MGTLYKLLRELWCLTVIKASYMLKSVSKTWCYAFYSDLKAQSSLSSPAQMHSSRQAFLSIQNLCLGYYSWTDGVCMLTSSKKRILMSLEFISWNHDINNCLAIDLRESHFSPIRTPFLLAILTFGAALPRKLWL